jgi:hypothetical protein
MVRVPEILMSADGAGKIREDTRCRVSGAELRGARDVGQGDSWVQPDC